MFDEFSISNVEFLAKGHRSLVYSGNYKNKKVAIKVAKPNLGSIKDRIIKNEVMWLNKLNKHGIGPKLIKSNKNLFICSLVEGERFFDWFDKSNKRDIMSVLKKVFRQLRVLDKLKVDKKEMHNPVKHILIGKDVVMIDFERCHIVRNPKNITQFCQFLMRDRIFDRIWKFDKNELVDLLRIYKKNQGEANYQNILKLLF